jgi:hypothetical protein
LYEIVARLLASLRIDANVHAPSPSSMRPGVLVLIVAFKDVEEMRCAPENSEREVRCIARCELTQEGLTGVRTTADSS